MFSERLQILVSKEQRRRLEREAQLRNTSVASVIRDAIDAELGRFTREARMKAVDEIAAMRGVPYIPPEELERLIDESRAEEIMRGMPGIPGVPDSSDR